VNPRDYRPPRGRLDRNGRYSFEVTPDVHSIRFCRSLWRSQSSFDLYSELKHHHFMF